MKQGDDNNIAKIHTLTRIMWLVETEADIDYMAACCRIVLNENLAGAFGIQCNLQTASWSYTWIT